MPLTFYHFNLSQPVRAIDLLLRANNIEHEKKEIDLQKGEHHSEEYKAINPFEAVPAITHNGFNMNESVAILRYLCATQNIAAHWYPTDVQKRARIDVYLAWQHMAIRMNGSVTFLAVAYKKIFDKDFGQEERVARAHEGFEKALDQLANIFLKETRFLSSEDITIADLLCVSELLQPMVTGYDMKGKHPKVFDYILRVRERVGTDLFDSIQKPIFDKLGGTYIV